MSAIKAVMRSAAQENLSAASRSPAPIASAMGITNPLQKPIKNPAARNATGEAAAMAAKAPTPAERPTISPSTRFDTCISALPSSIGQQKESILRSGFPPVISIRTRITSLHPIEWRARKDRRKETSPQNGLCYNGKQTWVPGAYEEG